MIFPMKRTNKSLKMMKWLKKSIVGSPIIDKNTKISSIGSCFAREIRKWLISNGYNYILKEQDKFFPAIETIHRGKTTVKSHEHSSVCWERVYNTHTLKHIIDYSFNYSVNTDRLYEINVGGKSYFCDLLRTRIIYDTKEKAIKDIYDHAQLSKETLLESDVFIITLGLTEIWESKKRGFVAASHVAKKYTLPDDFVFRKSYYEENISNLLYVYEVLKKHNKNLKIIVTVSPVHLLQTFRNDIDVISASCASKSILRSVADKFAELPDVYYFPSYEIATIGAMLDGINAYPDNHHVSGEMVRNIMAIFKANFIKHD